MPDKQNAIPTFDEVMGTDTLNGKIPSFDDIMGEPKPVKKKEPSPSAFSKSVSRFQLPQNLTEFQKPETEVIEDYNRQFETVTGYKSRKLFEPLKDESGILSTGYNEEKYQKRQKEKFTEYKKAEEEINPVLAGVQLGVVKPDELLKLSEKPYGKKIIDDLAGEYGGTDLTEISRNIQFKNRPQGVAMIEQREAELDNDIADFANKYKLSTTNSGLTEKVVSGMPAINPNDINSVSQAIETIRGNDIEGGDKQELLDKLGGKIQSLVSRQGINPELEPLQGKISGAVDLIDAELDMLRRKKGEPEVRTPGSLQEKEFATKHLMLGLSYLKHYNEGKYNNIVRSLDKLGKIAQNDYGELVTLGQNIDNASKFRESGANPNLIGSETNIEYATPESIKNQYRVIIGERAKAADKFQNTQYSKKDIMEWGKDLPYQNVVEQLAIEEQRMFHDAIPKAGWGAAGIRGVSKPFTGIKNTIQALSESPAETYLRSGEINTGKEALPSEKNKTVYKIIEGFTQMIPQLLLTRGLGTIGTTATGAALSSVPRAALSASQLNKINIGSGTFISSYLQTWGDDYAQALDKTGDPDSASFIATINSTAAAAFEATILPDAKILGDFQTALRGNANELIDILKKNKSVSLSQLREKALPAITKMVVGAAKVIGGENAEEIGTNIVSHISESIFSPQTAKDRDFAKETLDIVKETSLATVIPAILGGFSSSAAKSFTKETLTEAAINFDYYSDLLFQAKEDGRLTEQEYNNGIDLIQLHQRNIMAEQKDDEKTGTSQLDKAFEKTVKTVKQEIPDTEIQEPEPEEPTIQEVSEPAEEKPIMASDSDFAFSYESFRDEAMALTKFVTDSSFEYRLTIPGLSQADRELAIEDIKENRQTKRREKFESALKEMYDNGVITVNRGRGLNAETVDIPFDAYLGLNEKELEAVDLIPDEIIDVVKSEGITENNIDNFKHLFDGFPYTTEDFNQVKTYLSGQGKSDAGIKQTGKEGQEKIISTPQVKSEGGVDKASNGGGDVEATEENERIASEEKGQPETGTSETVPPAEPPKGDEVKPKFKNEPKAILNRVYESKNIRQETKKKFEERGLRYDPKSHDTSRGIAKEIIDEFGIESSVAMAESGRFDGDVNSMIFAESIDKTFEAEQKATTQADKIKFAEQWADYAIRYDETARGSGRFISAIYDFYKKSPLGVILSERAKRDEAFKDWFKKRETDYKEVWEAIKDEPEFKDLIKGEVEKQLKEERKSFRQKRRKKIEDIFDKAKFNGGQLSVSIIPPQVWNGAVEVMKQAALAGESIVSVIEQGVQYVKNNYKEAWDEESFKSEWKNRMEGMDAEVKPQLSTEEKQQKVLEKFRKKLSGLNEQQKEDVIRGSFKKLVENGALEYDEFKKIIADVIGLGELTADETARLSGFIKDMNAVQDLSDKLLKEESKEALRDFDRGVKKAEESATKLAGMLYNKPKIAQRTRSIIQLSTLGVVSLIKNPFYNIFHQLLVRLPKGVFMTLLDQTIYGASLLGNKVFGNPVIKPDVNILLAQKGYFKEGSIGGAQAIKQLFTGLTNKDYFQKEVYNSQIKPFQSWWDLFDWGRGKKNLTKGQIADKVIQGTVGVPAEGVARMLNIGDKPFRYAAEGAIAETIATQEFKLKGIERDVFLKLPKEKAKQIYLKRGLSEEQANKKAEEIEKRIVSEGEEAVFQQNNVISDVVGKIKQHLSSDKEGHPLSSFGSGAAKLFGLLNMPFVKTPVNIAWEVFNLVNPEFALFQSFAYGVRASQTKSPADILKAKKWMAHAATGWALLSATGYLASVGAISGDDEDEPYKQKEVKGKGTYEKPKRLNISKLYRIFSGDSTADEDGDVMVDLSWFGASGMIMNMQANKYENLSKEQRDQLSYIDELLMRFRSGATEGLTNSVFQGTLTAVDALRTGRSDQWILGMMNVGENLIEPATIAQISRASRPYEYQLKGDDFSDKLKNNIRARFFGKVTPKVNIWGEQMNREGSAGDVAMRMLGISAYDKDTFGEPIHQDFKRTGNSDFYPPAVSNKFTEGGKEITLNTEQQLQFETLVGQARKNIVGPFVNNAAMVNEKKYNQLTDEQKINELKKLYDKGRDLGKKQFLILYPEFATKPKPQPL